MPKLLTITDVCERLACGRDKVYRLLRAGELESVKIGRHRRVDPAALDEFIRRCASNTPRPERAA